MGNALGNYHLEDIGRSSDIYLKRKMRTAEIKVSAVNLELLTSRDTILLIDYYLFFNKRK